MEPGEPILLTVATSLAKDMVFFPFFSIIFFENQIFRGMFNFSLRYCDHLTKSIGLRHAEGVIPDLGGGP